MKTNLEFYSSVVITLILLIIVILVFILFLFLFYFFFLFSFFIFSLVFILFFFLCLFILVFVFPCVFIIIIIVLSFRDQIVLQISRGGVFLVSLYWFCFHFIEQSNEKAKHGKKLHHGKGDSQLGNSFTIEIGLTTTLRSNNPTCCPH